MAETQPGAGAEAVALTAMDRRAMLTAEQVCLHYYEGRSWLACSLRRREAPQVFSRQDQLVFPDTREVMPGERNRDIGCSVGLSGYVGESGAMWHGDPDGRAQCFAMVVAPRLSRVWQTVATLVKPGDRLTLAWTADNNNAVIREAGLHADSVSVLVSRGARTRYEFVVCNQITPDNSARMIRRHG